MKNIGNIDSIKSFIERNVCSKTFFSLEYINWLVRVCIACGERHQALFQLHDILVNWNQARESP